MEGPLSEIKSFIEYATEIDRLHNITIYGVKSLEGFHRLASETEGAWVDLGRKEAPDEKTLEFAAFIEEEAKKIRDSGFHLVFAHSSVSLWSALESMILNFCGSMLYFHPDISDREKLEKIRVSSSFVLQSDKRAAAFAILSELERNTGAHLKPGMGRFVEALSACGLDISVSEETRRSLLELSKVRNLVAHKFSICDDKFLKECPWFDAEKGKRIKLTSAQYSNYRKGIKEFLKVLTRQYTNTVGKKAK